MKVKNGTRLSFFRNGDWSSEYIFGDFIKAINGLDKIKAIKISQTMTGKEFKEDFSGFIK